MTHLFASLNKISCEWLQWLGMTDAEVELTEEQLGEATWFVWVSVIEVCTIVFHIHPNSERYCPFLLLQNFFSQFGCLQFLQQKYTF